MNILKNILIDLFFKLLYIIIIVTTLYIVSQAHNENYEFFHKIEEKVKKLTEVSI